MRNTNNVCEDQNKRCKPMKVLIIFKMMHWLTTHTKWENEKTPDLSGIEPGPLVCRTRIIPLSHWHRITAISRQNTFFNTFMLHMILSALFWNITWKEKIKAWRSYSWKPVMIFFFYLCYFLCIISFSYLKICFVTKSPVLMYCFIYIIYMTKYK